MVCYNSTGLLLITVKLKLLNDSFNQFLSNIWLNFEPFWRYCLSTFWTLFWLVLSSPQTQICPANQQKLQYFGPLPSTSYSPCTIKNKNYHNYHHHSYQSYLNWTSEEDTTSFIFLLQKLWMHQYIHNLWCNVNLPCCSTTPLVWIHRILISTSILKIPT
jgi:hypothetical protein